MPMEIPICEQKQNCRNNLINSAILRDVNNNNNNNNNNINNENDESLFLCSFNANKKMEPISFLVWMNILRRIPNSFLFLLDTFDIDAENRLLEQAAYNGILKYN
jgi:predicted O-linked N-acetylglucosamine transferase (SPINDLY family)